MIPRTIYNNSLWWYTALGHTLRYHNTTHDTVTTKHCDGFSVRYRWLDSRRLDCEQQQTTTTEANSDCSVQLTAGTGPCTMAARAAAQSGGHGIPSSRCAGGNLYWWGGGVSTRSLLFLSTCPAFDSLFSLKSRAFILSEQRGILRRIRTGLRECG